MLVRASRTLAIVALAIACKGEPPPAAQGRAVRTVQLPTEWESRGAVMGLRITNSSSTGSDVAQAMNTVANTRIDPMTLLMRGGLDFDEDGAPIAPEGTTEELLGGSSTSQVKAFIDRFVTAEEDPFAEGSITDSCGNELLFAAVAPDTLQHLSPSPQDLAIWPQSCPDGVDCNTLEFGTFDITMSEARFDGMTDMTINLFSDLSNDPIRPAFWGHLPGFFLTENNPLEAWSPMFASVGEARIDIHNVLQRIDTYDDVSGRRELFAFPHRARRLGADEIAVTLTPYSPMLDYWIRNDFSENDLPEGADQVAMPIDVTAALGAEQQDSLANATRLGEELTRTLEHHIGTTVACPPVNDRFYLKEGPVEIYVCPDGDLATCVAEEDIEEAACSLQPGPGVFLPAIQVNLLQPQPEPPPDAPVAQTVSVPFAQSPVLLSYLTIAAFEELTINIDVNPDSVLYLLGHGRAVSAINQSGGNQDLPEPILNSHCGESVAARYDVGSQWPAGTYTVTLDLDPDPDGAADSGDELLIESDTTRLWVYFTSLGVWRQE